VEGKGQIESRGGKHMWVKYSLTSQNSSLKAEMGEGKKNRSLGLGNLSHKSEIPETGKNGGDTCCTGF